MVNGYYIEAFDNEKAVVNKITELKNQGIAEENLYIAVQDKERLSMIHAETSSGAGEKTQDIKNKLTDLLSGNDTLEKSLQSRGLEEQEIERYTEAVQNGKILLFSDNVQESSPEGRGLNANAAYGDPLKNENSPFPPEELKGQKAEEVLNDRNNVRDSADFSADEATGVQNTASADRHDVTPTANIAADTAAEPRVVSTDHNDLEEMGSVQGRVPAADPNMTDVPPTRQGDNDVPSADRSKDRLSDTEYPEEWPQAATDRTQTNDRKG